MSGSLPLYNIRPDEYQQAHPQNHCILEAKDGKILVGNNGGIIGYDGSEWRKINGLEYKALTIIEDSSSIVYVGGENEVGYLDTDSLGQLYYHSILKTFPDSLQSFGRVYSIEYFKNSIILFTADKIFEIKNKSYHSLISGIKFGGSFKYNNNLYYLVPGDGIFSWNSESPKRVPQDFNITDNRIFIIAEDFVLAIGQRNILKINVNKSEFRFKSEHKYKFSNTPLKIQNAIYYSGHILLATADEGLLILDNNFKLKKRINTKNSILQNDFIRNILIDKNNALWLALDKGISVLDISSPYVRYQSKENIRGVINDLLVNEDNIFVGGSQGLIKKNIDDSEPFNLATDITGECWALENINLENTKGIGFATDNTVEFLNNNGSIDSILRALPWDLAQSKFRPERLWIGNDNGVITASYSNNKFTFEFQNSEINKQIRKIVTVNNGEVWMGARSKHSGVYFLDESNLDSGIFMNPVFYDSTFGLPYVPYVFPFLINSKVYFATTKGIYEFDRKKTAFNLSQDFDHPLNINQRNILNMCQIGSEKVWLTSKEQNKDFQNGIFNFKDKDWVYKPYIELSKAVQFASFYDSIHDNLWVAGSEGLFRIKNLNPKPLKSYQAFISQIKYDPDSLMFGGHMFDDFVNNTYNYSRKPLRFSFGANSYKRKDDLKFKYFLEGFDETWTDWNEEAEAVYTNLPGGSYTMRVRAIDFFENESEEASFSFTILPPWYLTPWAYTLYFFGFIAFVYAAIRVSTISLQRVIKENTKEIVAQKDEIEAKNTVLESQKGRIEKQNLNILDSIRYAKRIQMATLPAEDKIQKSVENAWVMYRPKDIVSGDFYWLENYKDEKTEKTLIAAVDCTGHGVPGAFMSIIGYNGLNRVVREYRLNRPSEVLDRLNEIITNTLNQQGTQREEIKDGMDMSLCSLDRKNLKLEYAGAHNSLYVIRKGEEKLILNGEEYPSIMNDKGHNLFEIKADKQPIGAFENRKNFTNHEIQLIKNDMIILFTDGYADQFGGPKGKKFFYKPFKRLLLSIADEDVKKQHEIIENTFNDWISYPDSGGDAHEQVDDICVIGVRV
ncbi:MAG: SpoIIE family protein phosphatase [Cytophagales bacterium]